MNISYGTLQCRRLQKNFLFQILRKCFSNEPRFSEEYLRMQKLSFISICECFCSSNNCCIKISSKPVANLRKRNSNEEPVNIENKFFKCDKSDRVVFLKGNETSHNTDLFFFLFFIKLRLFTSHSCMV